MQIFYNRTALAKALLMVSLTVLLSIQTTWAQSQFKAGNTVSTNTISPPQTKRDKEAIKRETMAVFFAKWDSNKWEKIKKLLEESPALVNARPAGSGWLHRACQEGNLEAAEWLLSHGMDVNVQSDGGGSTPLFYARDAKVAQLLLDNGADVDIENTLGRTALYDLNFARN